jgi:hypothetical protein
VASKRQIRGLVLLIVVGSLLVASDAEISGLRTHLGAWNHANDAGYHWFVLPFANIRISDMQQGISSPYYHPGPHIRWPGFEYVQVYREFRIPWRANISTFYTVALPVTALAALVGGLAQRRARKRLERPA